MPPDYVCEIALLLKNSIRGAGSPLSVGLIRVPNFLELVTFLCAGHRRLCCRVEEPRQSFQILGDKCAKNQRKTPVSDQFVTINVGWIKPSGRKFNGLAGFCDLQRMDDSRLNEGQIAGM